MPHLNTATQQTAYSITNTSSIIFSYVSTFCNIVTQIVITVWLKLLKNIIVKSLSGISSVIYTYSSCQHQYQVCIPLTQLSFILVRSSAQEPQVHANDHQFQMHLLTSGAPLVKANNDLVHAFGGVTLLLRANRSIRESTCVVHLRV
ncbi:Hypothetical_protein [Hexamita inflata]|uniref:Hypothetical_protein n=1 Tax=Hexamita inflata TaxID=28002 RepID=A0AA86UYU9_9EUKA|nr:Hypothetical protein HINF_LOCUS61184 [Hexamita inflata]